MNFSTLTFAKMSDLKPTSAAERAMLDSVQATFPHAVVRHYAVTRVVDHNFSDDVRCTHHKVTVETAEFFCGGSGELLGDALGELFCTLGDLEISGELGAYVA